MPGVIPRRDPQEQKMSKSGQPATKADTGGQRVPKTTPSNTGSDKKSAPTATASKADKGKKPSR